MQIKVIYFDPSFDRANGRPSISLDIKDPDDALRLVEYFNVEAKRAMADDCYSAVLRDLTVADEITKAVKQWREDEKKHAQVEA